MITPLDWANSIATTLETALAAHNADSMIGNPNVGGDAHRCGTTVVIDFGQLYRTTEPWPTQWGNTARSFTRESAGENDAQEFFVRVQTCVPGRDETGNSPDATRRDPSVLDVADIGLTMHTALWAQADVWRTTAGYGRVAIDPVTPEPKEGLFGGWSTRIVVPVCVR